MSAAEVAVTRRLRMGLCAAVLVVGCIQVGAVFARSLIPLKIDGTLTEAGIVGDSHLKLHWIRVGDRVYDVDNARVADLRVGRHLSKQRWDTKLTVDGHKQVRLTLGEEFFQFLVLALLATAACWRLTRGSS